MVERKTLGISRGEAAPKNNAREGFALTGARLEKLKERARIQRHNPSPAQEALWGALSGAQLGGVKFTRQAIVGSAIVDFACPSRWIVVLISPEGANAEVETLQDGKLTQVGVRVLRFAEAEILGDLAAVVKAIAAETNKPFDKRAARRGVGGVRMEDSEA
ncbi:DUF559 domain-containing protein [Novosphingobium sp. 1949]|uniref:DUF559 domain-containing protein n=1 Tax=Novosphingobium organovorum TaxID=2930092 RepID=A0ABT0BBL9_9SPHN|nr:DUF559 domain-containing protein [Novosphingobium organovorum]MCJ2182253.1 DUF559 domain-containing protein [Novosphingobium organovorum]